MTTAFLRRCRQGLRGLALVLLSTWAAAGPAGANADPAVLESLGMYVASLQRTLERHDLRGLTDPSEHQAGMLDLQVRDAQMVRRHLRTRGGALPPDSRQAKVLQAFLEAWTEEGIAEGLRASPRESRLDPAVRQLARTFPEARSSRPLFPFFRP